MGFGFWVLGFGLVLGFGFGVQGSGFWVLGFGFWVVLGFRVCLRTSWFRDLGRGFLCFFLFVFFRTVPKSLKAISVARHLAGFRFQGSELRV